MYTARACVCVYVCFGEFRVGVCGQGGVRTCVHGEIVCLLVCTQRAIHCVSVLGESDLIYTETLIGVGREDFCGRTALILGGGDGGILHELLKQNPEHVTMAEVRMRGAVH